MSFETVTFKLQQVSNTKGIIACALVAIDSGIIYCTTSRASAFQKIAEGARDYWSLHARNGEIYSILSELKNIHIQHEKGILSLQPCGINTLLVTLAKHNQIQWGDWSDTIQQLKKLVDEYHNSEVSTAALSSFKS